MKPSNSYLAVFFIVFEIGVSEYTSISLIIVFSSFYNIDYPYYNATGRNYTTSNKAPIKPVQEICIPTESDYELGEYRRYFLKKNNEVQYIEVKGKQLQLYVDKSGTVQWQLYTPITITWVLEGKLEDVYNTNKNIVKLYETQNKLIGFVSYFNDRFAKFHIEETPSRKQTTTSPKISGY